MVSETTSTQTTMSASVLPEDFTYLRQLRIKPQMQIPNSVVEATEVTQAHQTIRPTQAIRQIRPLRHHHRQASAGLQPYLQRKLASHPPAPNTAKQTKETTASSSHRIITSHPPSYTAGIAYWEMAARIATRNSRQRTIIASAFAQGMPLQLKVMSPL